MIERNMTIRRVVDETEPAIDVLDRIFERKAEEALLKLYAKVYDKKTIEELESRDLAHLVAEPVIFFDVNGETERVATTEGDGRDTAVNTPKEFDEEDAEQAAKLAEKFAEGGVTVSPSGLVTKEV